MGLKTFFTQKRFAANVTRGQIGKKAKPAYVIWKEEQPGVVTVDKVKYYFLGYTEESFDEVSAARAIGFAAVGSLFSPILGTLVGGAIGAKKKTKKKYVLGFKEIESGEVYTVESELQPIEFDKLKHFDTHKPE